MAVHHHEREKIMDETCEPAKAPKTTGPRFTERFGISLAWVVGAIWGIIAAATDLPGLLNVIVAAISLVGVIMFVRLVGRRDIDRR